MSSYIKKELVLFVLTLATSILSAQKVVLKVELGEYRVSAEVISINKDTLTKGKAGRFYFNRDALRPYMCKAFGAAFSPEEQEKLRGFVRNERRIMIVYYFYLPVKYGSEASIFPMAFMRNGLWKGLNDFV